MSGSSRPILGVLIGVAVVAALAVPKLLEFRSTPTDTEGPSEASALKVRVHRVVPEILTEGLQTTGTVRANEEVEIVSEVSGTISAIFFDEGRRVSAGDVLLKIDDSELMAERQRAIYRVELAQRAEARQQQLLDDGVISSETYDVALGQLNVLRAERDLIDAQLAKTEVKAPFGGIIGLRWVSPGSYLSSQTRIATLSDVDPVKLEFNVPEQHATAVRKGATVNFTVQGVERAFKGTIYAMDPTVDASTRSLRMRARCANPDGLLVPGVFANVELVLREIPDALPVPSIAVIPELGGTKVFVYRDGTAEPRSVVTGIRTEDTVEITSGLVPGDQVITTGILQMRPGLEVELEETPGGAGAAS